MARIYNDNEVKILKEGGKKLALVVKKLSLQVKEGQSAKEIEQIAEDLIEEAGGSPSFLNYKGFPGAVCISVNEEVVHTIPASYKFKKGDLVSIDVGLKYKGLHTDMAVTIAIGRISREKKKFLNTCKKALRSAIKAIKPGVTIGTIGNIIQHTAENEGYSVVRELTGHGIGKDLHEPPCIANYGENGIGEILKKDMVIAIEPIINMGGPDIISKDKEWRVATRDKSPSCHFEHTILVTKRGAEILTK